MGVLTPIVVVLVAAVIALFLVAWGVSKLLEHASPDEVKVFTGSGKSVQGEGEVQNVTYVRGGRKLRIPFIHRVWTMSLAPFKINLRLEEVLTSNNLKISISGVAIVGFGDTMEMVRTAAGKFLHYSPAEIEDAVQEILTGHVRGVISTLTAEAANQDRERLRANLKDAAEAEYRQIGMFVLSFQIQEISDREGLFTALGATRLAQAKAKARKDEAEADRDARIAEAEADRAAAVAQAGAEGAIAEANRDRDVRRAKADAATAEEQARMEQAGPLADAVARQAVVEAEVEVDRRRVAAELEHERARKETVDMRLQADVIAPAQADKDRVELDAQAEKRKVELTAEASKRRVELEAEAEAAKVQALADAAAHKVEVAGEAEAASQTVTAASLQAELEAQAAGDLANRMAEANGTEALLLAQALGQEKLAEALGLMDDRAMQIQLITDLIPALKHAVAAAAAPIGEIDQLTVIDTGSGNGTGAIEKLLTTTPAAIGTGMEILKAFPGLSDLLANFMASAPTSSDSDGGTEAQ